MIYIVIAAILMAAELLYFKIADRFNIIDRPNMRSSHTSITLRGGGVVFLFGAWGYAAFFGVTYPWFLTGLTLVGIVSFVDDVHSLPDSVRLVVQFAAMFLMFYQFGILNWNDWWIVCIALIVCVGITNAYNFMDGINGITGAYSLAVMLPLLYLNESVGFIEMPFLVVITLSILVFLFFNFRKKAKCFAGDVGSISMAFIVVFALGLLMLQTRDFSYIVFLAVYGVDAVLTIVHRIMLHENLGEAHRKHAYQLMANELKVSHLKVSAGYMLVQLAVSAGLIFIPINHYLYLGLVIVLLSAAYVAFMRKKYHLHEEYLKSKAS
ncbi:glycosyltransferase family 4 protein [Bacteroides caecimuris]|uniref:MraY family glycosyltransferase n=1 Tax=Bacteroides caecimuris TaxID=1796613 RepID=UPI0026594127|nr:glycosyltransferase family 4 protein [Bacteroides caecimuris]